MGTGQQAISTISQSANTAANLTVQAATLLGLALNKKDFDLVQSWQENGYVPDSLFIVPSERMFEFRMLADANGIEFAEIQGQDYESEEFIQIITKGPKASEQITDAYGNVISINKGFEGDRLIVEQLVNQVIDEYRASHNLDQNRTDELGNQDTLDNDLSSGEAQRAFKNANTVQVHNLSRSEMELLTKHADTLNIDTFVRYDYVADKYSVELSESVMQRAANAPDVQSKGERLLQDFLIVSSHPAVCEIMKKQDTTYDLLRKDISMFQNGDLNIDMVLTSVKDLKIGEKPSKSIILHKEGIVEIMESKDGTGNTPILESKTYDIHTKEGIELFYEHFKSMRSVQIMNYDDYLDIVNADIDNVDEVKKAESVLALFKSSDRNNFPDEIALSGLKASIYRQSELLAKDKMIELAITESGEKSLYQTVEQRIPNSDTIITDTILSATRDNNKAMIDEMKKLLDERLKSMKVTNASMFESIPSYMLKDQGELLQDQRTLSVEAGQSQGLTISEANLYANSIELFQDKAHDNKNPMVNSHTSIILVETQITNDGEEIFKFSNNNKTAIDSSTIYLDQNGNDITDKILNGIIELSQESDYINEATQDNNYDEQFYSDDFFSEYDN